MGRTTINLRNKSKTSAYFDDWLIRAVSLSGHISGMRNKTNIYTTYDPVVSHSRSIGLSINLYRYLVYINYREKDGGERSLVSKYSVDDDEDIMLIQDRLDSVFGKEFFRNRITECDWKLSDCCKTGVHVCRLSPNIKLGMRWQCQECEKIEKSNKTNLRDMTGFVYFIGNLEEYPYIKIGKTNNLKNRRKLISIELPVKIDILHSIISDNASVAEKYFHDLYRDKRSNGEWFKLSQQDMIAVYTIKSFYNGTPISFSEH